MGYGDYGSTIIQLLAQKRAEEKAKEAQKINPLGVIGSGLAGLVGGGGNPIAGILGLIQGLGATNETGAAGLAQAGVGAYRTGSGLKERQQGGQFLDKILKDKKVSLPEGLSVGDLPEETRSTFLKEYARSLFPTKKQPNVLELLLLASNPKLMNLYNTGGLGSEWEQVE